MQNRDSFGQVGQVGHLKTTSESVSVCNATPCQIKLIVRNDEAGGSIPPPSTKITCLRPSFDYAVTTAALLYGQPAQ